MLNTAGVALAHLLVVPGRAAPAAPSRRRLPARGRPPRRHPRPHAVGRRSPASRRVPGRGRGSGGPQAGGGGAEDAGQGGGRTAGVAAQRDLAFDDRPLRAHEVPAPAQEEGHRLPPLAQVPREAPAGRRGRAAAQAERVREETQLTAASDDLRREDPLGDEELCPVQLQPVPAGRPRWRRCRRRACPRRPPRRVPLSRRPPPSAFQDCGASQSIPVPPGSSGSDGSSPSL